MLFDLYRAKFGEYLPLIRRQDVKGFIKKQPLWLMRPLGLDEVRKYAENMEFEAERFYRKAADTTRDASMRKLLLELAEIEAQHENLAHKLDEKILTSRARAPGGRDRAAHVPAAIRAAGSRRPDGRLGLDAGAAVRRRLRHPQHLGDLPGRHGGRRSAPAFRWALPKPPPTTARSPDAARRGCAARSAG